MKTSISFALMLPVLTLCAQAQMTNIEEQNEADIRSYFEEVWNKHNPDIASDYLAADAKIDGDKLNQMVADYLAAFPDIHLTIDDLIAKGDIVVTRYTFTATHRGEFRGVPATGRKIKVRGISYTLFADGKAVNDWGLEDMFGLMQQLQDEAAENE